MEYIIEGIKEAILLILSFDKEIYSIIFLSLSVSFISTILASLIGIPVGMALTLNEFKFKRLFSKIIYSLMGVPPVVLGLFVFISISRNGPLGKLGLLFTPIAMIVAQTLLVLPIVIGIVFNNLKVVIKDIKEECYLLGGNTKDLIKLLFAETKPFMFIAITTAFGRAISEVGTVMIVGGNIKNYTRTMTTFIALNNSMGNYSKGIAMGIVLLVISFLTNSLLYTYFGGGKK